MSPSVVRIVRIITRLNIGGPSIHAALLSTRLDPTRFSTCLVVGRLEATEGDMSETGQGSQVRMVRLPLLRRSIRPWADVVSLMQLLGILWRERPQSVQDLKLAHD
jgi:hypothetical protein